jgi:hypothetical protein
MEQPKQSVAFALPQNHKAIYVLGCAAGPPNRNRQGTYHGVPDAEATQA